MGKLKNNKNIIISISNNLYVEFSKYYFRLITYEFNMDAPGQ